MTEIINKELIKKYDFYADKILVTSETVLNEFSKA